MRLRGLRSPLSLLAASLTSPAGCGLSLPSLPRNQPDGLNDDLRAGLRQVEKIWGLQIAIYITTTVYFSIPCNRFCHYFLLSNFLLNLFADK